MAVDLNDPLMADYKPVGDFVIGDHDHSSLRIRDTPPGKPRFGLTINPETLTFSGVAVDSTSAPQTVLLTNSGYEALTIEGAQAVGDFAVHGAVPTKIAPGATASIQVVYKPKQAGLVTGGLYIKTGNAAGQEFVSLSGSTIGFQFNAISEFLTRNDAMDWETPAAVDYIRTTGYATPGDGGASLYKRVVAEPSHAGKFSITTTVGETVWYEITGSDLRVEQLGALGAGVLTTEIQNTLNIPGVKIVRADSRQFLSDDVNVPAGVEFRCNMKLNTPATVAAPRSFVKINPKSKVIGILEGTSRTGTEAEHGVHVAVDNCDDVYLDVTVIGFTIGVKANFSATAVALAPRRWKGTIRAFNISGVSSVNGYAFLAGSLRNSEVTVFSVNTQRHVLYCSAGGSNNHYKVFSKGDRGLPVDLASFAGQEPVKLNKIEAHIEDMVSDHPLVNHYGVVMFGAVHYNDVQVFIKFAADSASAVSEGAVLMAATDVNNFPYRNRVRVVANGWIDGPAFINCQSGWQNRLSIEGEGGSSVNAPLIRVATNDGITPAGSYGVTAVIEKVDFEILGSSMVNAIWGFQGYGMLDMGAGVIKPRGQSGAPVHFSTFGDFVTGWLYEHYLQVTTSSMAAGASADAVFTYPISLPTKRFEQYSVFVGGAAGDQLPDHAIVARTADGMTVRVRNNRTLAASAVVTAVVRGF